VVISLGPKQAPSSHHLVAHISAMHQQETVRECERKQEVQRVGIEGVGEAELEGLQEHQSSSVDQHFLRDLQGPVGWTHSRRKGQIQPSYTFIECFVEKHPWHTPRSGSSVCHMAQEAPLADHMTIVMTLKGSFLNTLRPRLLAALLFGKCSLGHWIMSDAFGPEAGIKNHKKHKVETRPKRLCKISQIRYNNNTKCPANASFSGVVGSCLKGI